MDPKKSTSVRVTVVIKPVHTFHGKNGPVADAESALGRPCTAGNANRYMRHCTPADDYRAQTMFCQSKALVCAPVLLCQACAARPFFQKAAVYGVSSGGGAARHQGRA